MIISLAYVLALHFLLLQCDLAELGNIFVALPCLFLAVQFLVVNCVCCITIFSFVAPHIPRFVARQAFFVFLSLPGGWGAGGEIWA